MNLNTSGGNREMDTFSLLVVDDEENLARAIAKVISSEGVDTHTAFTARDAIELCRARAFDMILLDHRLPDDDGVRIIPLLLSINPETTIVMMTAYESISSAVQAIRLGAYDYIVKSTTLSPIIKKVEEVRRRTEIRKQSNMWEGHKANGLLGVSRAIQKVRQQIQQVASSPETTVLVVGESGVGKEVAVRLLHEMSAGENKPFITVDCTSIPDTLAESLLFGYVQGAFTGANRDKAGAFEEAKDGTLFLDEIGDLDIKLQGKLLRVLENRTFQRVGSVEEQPMRARIVAATNRDLQSLVDHGDFRFDLYQRLSVFPIYIPPLRERREDILVLADHFQRFFFSKLGKEPADMPQEVQEALLAYDYSGNVRELKNIIERAVILADGNRIELHHLPERMLSTGSRRAVISNYGAFPFDFIPGVDTMESFEMKLINYALELSGGVKTEAAKMLGISRFQLIRRLEKYKNKTKKTT